MKRDNSLLNIWICLFLLLVTTACSSDGPGEEPEKPIEIQKEEVEFTISLNGLEITKAGVDGTNFLAGDQFKLFFNSTKPPFDESGREDSIRIYTLNSSGNWNTTTPMYWDDQFARYRDICAITLYDSYGDLYKKTNTDTDYFSVKTDQTGKEDYLASDLLISRTTTDKRLIPLPFYHVMSRILVNIGAPTKENPEGWFTVQDFTGLTATLTNMYPKAAIKYGVDPTETKSDITVTTVEESESTGNILMYPLNNIPEERNDSVFCSFVAIIPPRATLEQGQTLLSIKIVKEDDKGNTYLFKPGILGRNFSKQGYQTTINVSLKKTDVIAEIVETDIEIVPWGTGKVATDDDPITLK